MPIHDLGYRGWTGEVSSSWIRCWTIALSGIKVAARNKWLRRILILAWIPTFVFGTFLFVYEQTVDRQPGALNENQIESLFFVGLAEAMVEDEIVREGLRQADPVANRSITWRWILSTFLRLPQAGWTMLIIGMLAPPLIARDIRSKAFLLYFSRPINRYEYVLGKIAIVSVYIFFITTLPALGCYIVGLFMSSDWTAIFQTWDIPFRIVAASLVFIIPASSVALMFSSLTPESRFAAFAWFSTWGLGIVAWRVIYGVLMFSATIADQPQQMELNQTQYEISRRMEEELAKLGIPEEQIGMFRVQLIASIRNATDVEMFQGERYRMPREFAAEYLAIEEEKDRLRRKTQAAQQQVNRHPASVVSLYDSLVKVQRWVFGLEKLQYAWPAIVAAILMTALSWLILLRKVTAPIRI